MNDIMNIFLILLSQMFQNPDFLLRLPVESLLVADHFERHVSLRFMIIGFHDLSKASFTDNFDNFIAISDVVMWNLDVGALIVIVATIIRTTNHTLSFLCVWTNKPDFWIIKDLMMFKTSQFVHELFHCCLWRHGQPASFKRTGAICARSSSRRWRSVSRNRCWPMNSRKAMHFVGDLVPILLVCFLFKQLLYLNASDNRQSTRHGRIMGFNIAFRRRFQWW